MGVDEDEFRFVPSPVPVLGVFKSELSDYPAWVNATRAAPRCKLHWVNPAVADFRAVHHGVVHAEPFSEGSLGKPGFRSHPLQHSAHASVNGFVLRSC